MGAGDLELTDLEEAPLQLLRAWRDKDIKLFRKLLKNCNVNAEYKEEKYQPILGILSREKTDDVKEYAEAVLAQNAEKDQRYMSGLCPIHHAAEVANIGVITALVAANADINIGDQNGSTALHILAMKKWSNPDFQKCTNLLLSQPGINVNIRNNQGYTPVTWATLMKNKEAVICMLDYEKVRNLIDFDESKLRNLTVRQEILKQYPDLEDRLPKDKGPKWSYIKMDITNLAHLLRDREFERFRVAFTKEMEDKTQGRLLRELSGQDTLLQYACKNNLPVVELLLQYGADPNLAYDGAETPIHIAARFGYPEILKLLLEKSDSRTPDAVGSVTPLHIVTKYSHNSKPHYACLEMLLEKQWGSEKFDVNAEDVLGFTPLFYTVLYNDDESTALLLRKGAYTGVTANNQTLLSRMNPKVLEAFLDEHMTFHPTHESAAEQFDFDFSFLRPPSAEFVGEPGEKTPLHDKPLDYESETLPILHMAQSPDLRYLVAHPVLTSFTFIKWQRINVCFLTNLILYAMFCVLLTAYILFASVGSTAPEKGSPNSFVSEVTEKPGLHDKSTAEVLKPAVAEDAIRKVITLVVRGVLVMFILLLLLREVFQLVIDCRKYIATRENFLEAAIIALASFVVLGNCGERSHPFSSLAYVCPQVNAVAILLSWMGLVLLIGKHPRYAVQVEMFRKVSVSFARFLSCYLLLILAFTLSFYVLFRDCTGPDCASNKFTTEGSSLFKTIVMLTGEFEAGEIPVNTYIGTSHVIFAMFIFLIAIVLLNLLNGLAVDDTKIIKHDAYLYSCCARVEFIVFVESLFSGRALARVRHLASRSLGLLAPLLTIFHYFARRLALFHGFLPDGDTIVVHSLEGNIFEVTGRKYYLDNETIRKAKETEARKQETAKSNSTDDTSLTATNEKIETLTKHLLELQGRFEAIEKSNKQIEELIIQNMRIASLNHANSDDR